MMLDRVQAEKLFVQMLTMWIVSQQPNEYNPIHIHTECQLSCVMYLKVPKFEPPRKAHRNSDDGSITFISNSPKDTEFGASPMTIRPSVGDIFIFSAAQQHEFIHIVAQKEIQKEGAFHLMLYLKQKQTEKLTK